MLGHFLTTLWVLAQLIRRRQTGYRPNGSKRIARKNERHNVPGGLAGFVLQEGGRRRRPGGRGFELETGQAVRRWVFANRIFIKRGLWDSLHARIRSEA